MNYWLLLASPDKWFCDKCNENANVNETLKNLEKQSWKVRKDYFKDAKIGDCCIIKISKDNRSIERTILQNGNVIDLLDSGIYALGKISKELYLDDDNEYRIEIEITRNLFKEDKIINSEISEKILGGDFFVQGSKKIEKEKYDKFLAYLERNEVQDELEGDSNLEPNSNIENTIYPANVKVTRDVFSVYELKRKYEERKTVQLDPDFQREDVWNRKQQSELIESILMGIPLPVMYFAEDKYGNLQVIDGRQRLTSLFKFLNNNFSISSSPILTHLKGKKIKDLDKKDQIKLEDYQLIVYIIKPQTPDRIKFDIFDRVNRGGTQLNKQEMRNALYQGSSTLLLKELSKMTIFKKATGYAISSKRMKDRYIILRFLAFYLYFENKVKIEYKSDIDDFLGKIMEYLNQIDEHKLNTLKEIFQKSMYNSYEILGKNAFRIPNYKRKRPINMALFESLSYLMSFDISKYNRESVKDKVKSLFNNENFIKSLTERIDSSKSVEIRFDIMKTILKEIKNEY